MRTKTAKKKTVITDPRRFGRPLLCALLLAVVLTAAAPVRVAAFSKPLKDHYALIVGTVWDAENHPVYGVKVQLRRADGKKVLEENYSNHSGEVAFRVPEGKADYLLVADVKSSKGKTKPQAIAHVEKDERVEVSLHLTE